MEKKYDFSGWATKNDIRCSDGRTIRDGAFKECDGKVVPLVWQHQHDSPTNVLGHALLKWVPKKGMRAYGKFNDTEIGEQARSLVENGDITTLSIYANQLKQDHGDVLHGTIREVSLVLAGANPGAVIDFPILMHGNDVETIETEATICMDLPIKYSGFVLEHAYDDEEDEDVGENEEMAISEVFETLDDDQKEAVYALIGAAVEEATSEYEDSDYEGDDDDDDDAYEDEDEDDYDEEMEHSYDNGYEEGYYDAMKHNVFTGMDQRDDYLTHSDQQAIVELAKNNNVGSFQAALKEYVEDNFLMHDGDDDETTVTVGGFEEQYMNSIYPEYKNVGPAAPELITNDMGWVDVVLSKTHKSPISRIRTRYSDIRDIEALRAKGYKKGEMKRLTGQIKLAHRTTDPQTVYVKNALHRDDIVDITDFDYVQYLYNIDKMQLNEELAKAIMIGDLREDTDPDKIFPEHIRPIWTDVDPYVIHRDIDLEAMATSLQGSQTGEHFGENYIYAEAIVQELLYAREKFKGSGQPDMFLDPHVLNVMLLARDLNGRRIYATISELEAALNVKKIYTAEQFAGKVRKDGDNNYHKLLAIVGNLADYQVGSTKGGEVTHFTQFDIDFNQQKSLLETRCSGAITKLYSFIVLEEPTEAPSNNSEVVSGGGE